MLKKIHEITLRDIILLDATKTANSLKKYWFVPLFLFRKQLEKLTGEIFRLIGNGDSFNLNEEFEKILAYRRLQILEALYKAVIIELGLKSRIGAWQILMGKDVEESEQLFEEVKKEVLYHTGIAINTPDDVTLLRDYIELKADKYKEMYPEISNEGREEVALTKVIYSVFNYMSEPCDLDMLLIVFCSMKQMAEDKIKKQQKEESNGE